MLSEITLKEAVELMENGDLVYGVNLNQDEPKLFKLKDLLAETRILADLPEGYKKKAGRKKADLTEEEVAKAAKNIDKGKLAALKRGGWTLVEIADEFKYAPKDMERIMAVLEQK